MEMQDKAELKAYISLIENSLLPAEVINLNQLVIIFLLYGKLVQEKENSDWIPEWSKF